MLGGLDTLPDRDLRPLATGGGAGNGVFDLARELRLSAGGGEGACGGDGDRGGGGCESCGCSCGCT